MSNSRPTLKDVAERSGYALRTVKNVMSGKPTVGEPVREAVLKAVAELGYKRNMVASALAKNRSLTIAALFTEDGSGGGSSLRRGIARCEDDLRDFGLSVEYFPTQDGNWQTQSAVLSELFNREEVDGVLLQPLSLDKLDSQIDALVYVGKPVVLLGSDAPASRRTCYIGPDAYKAGRIASQILANYIGKRGVVCALGREAGNAQTIQRMQGFRDRITEHYPGITVRTLDAPEDSIKDEELIAKALAADGVAALFCNGVPPSLAGEVLRELGRQDIVLVGFGPSERTAQLMREGYIQVLIDEHPEEYAYTALRTLFRYLTEDEVPERLIHTPVSVLTSECLP